jgi:putative protease
MELVCPAGNLPSLKKAVQQGADSVYVGFKDDTNARHFAGLNFTPANIGKAVEFAHKGGCKVFLAINTYPQPAGWSRWETAVASAAEAGIDALIVADIGVMEFARKHFPDLRLHLSVQGSATNEKALSFYYENFAIQRAVLPRVLSLSQVKRLIEKSPVELEVFGFGSLCIMAEGRCLLSSYVTGQSPNNFGACSPATAVRWTETSDGLQSRLNNVLIDSFRDDENAGYPTLCKGRFRVEDNTYNALEEPTSLNTLDLLPELYLSGIKAIKIEGRQRSPAYVEQVTRVWREAIDLCIKDPQMFCQKAEWQNRLASLSEGSQTTLGAYHRPWQ